MISSAILALLPLILAILWWYFGKLRVPYRCSDLYVLITGCDTGFGNEASKKFAHLGFHVFACCLTEHAFNTFKFYKTNRLIPILMNVRKAQDIIRARNIVKEYLPPQKGLWAVINNAGVAGAVGVFESLDPDEYMECFDVNVLGMVRVNKYFLPLLRQSQGRIINVASFAGRFAFSFASPYVVSKFGVEGYSDTIRRELYKQGVRVIIIEPGLFDTGLIKKTTIKELAKKTFRRLPRESKTYFGDDYIDRCMRHYKGDILMKKDTSVVVSAYLDALTSLYPKYRYVIGMDAIFLLRFLNVFPEWLSDFVISGRMAKPDAEINN